MEYFDGTEEEMKEKGLDRFGNVYRARSYETGSTPLKYSLGFVKITALIFIIVIAIMVVFALLIGLVVGDLFLVTILISVFVISLGSVAVLTILILFLTQLVNSKKILENNKTGITGQGIEIGYQRDNKLPRQITFVPYEYLSNVRPVTDEEWKEELGMGGIFRKITDTVKDIPNLRCVKGAGKKNVFVLQMSSEMPLKSYKTKTGSIGIMGALFVHPALASMDQYVDENEGGSSKIFFSIPNEKYNEFVQLMNQTMKKWKEKPYEPSTQRSYEDKFLNY